MELSKRAEELVLSATLGMKARVQELRAAGREIFDFGLGEPRMDSPRPAIEAAHRALDGGLTRYTRVAGLGALRRAVARSHGELFGAPWDEDQVLISVGAKSALFELFLALLEPGDELALPRPAWVSYQEQLTLVGGRPRWVPTDWRDGFQVTAEAVAEVWTPRIRALLVNSPSNPTGAVASLDNLRALAALCAERGAALVVDETYCRLVYDGARPTSASQLAAEFPDTVVVVGSFSKLYCMTGWRLGTALGPRRLIERLEVIQSHLTSNPTAFAMAGAVAALEEGEEHVRRLVAEYQLRRDLVLEALGTVAGVQTVPSAGGMFAFPRVRELFGPGCESSEVMARRLLDEAGVALLPGAYFGDDDHLRLSWVAEREEIVPGLERLVGFLGRLGVEAGIAPSSGEPPAPGDPRGSGPERGHGHGHDQGETMTMEAV